MMAVAKAEAVHWENTNLGPQAMQRVLEVGWPVVGTCRSILPLAKIGEYKMFSIFPQQS